MAVTLPSPLPPSFQGVSTLSVNPDVLMGSQNTTLAFGQPAVDSFSPTPALRTLRILQDGDTSPSRTRAPGAPARSKETDTAGFKRHVDQKFRQYLYESLRSCLRKINSPQTGPAVSYYLRVFKDGAAAFGRDPYELAREMGQPIEKKFENDHILESQLEAIRKEAKRLVKEEGKSKAEEVLIRITSNLLARSDYAMPDDLIKLYTAAKVLSDLTGVSLLEAANRARTKYGRWGAGITAVVRKAGELRFDEYFKAAMFDDDFGLYTANETARELIGSRASSTNYAFTTASENPIFGEIMAEWTYQRWIAMGRPRSFDIVEMGAGNGTLAKRILDYISERGDVSDAFSGEEENWREFRRAVKYTIVEISPPLIRKQQKKLKGRAVKFVQADARSFRLPRKVKGVFLSNELVDMFPPRKFVHLNGQWHEAYITIDEHGQLQEVYKPVSGETSDDATIYLLTTEPNPYDGKAVYYHPDVKPWIENMAGQAEEGITILTIDYGISRTAEPDGKEQELITKSLGKLFDTGSSPLDELVCPGRSSYLNPLLPTDMSTDVDSDLVSSASAEAGLAVTMNSAQVDFLRGVIGNADPDTQLMYKKLEESDPEPERNYSASSDDYHLKEPPKRVRQYHSLFYDRSETFRVVELRRENHKTYREW